jgi:hypothetical protein
MADDPRKKDSYWEGEDNFAFGGPYGATGFNVFSSGIKFYWRGYRGSTSNYVGLRHGPFNTAKEAHSDAAAFDGYGGRNLPRYSP